MAAEKQKLVSGGGLLKFSISNFQFSNRTFFSYAIFFFRPRRISLWLTIFLTVLGSFLIINQASAATYYVNCNADNDDGAGTSEGTAWKTIAKVNSTLTGDQSDTNVLFKKDCTWREQLTVPGSGTSGHPFTFGAYGDSGDPKPVINGADLVTDAWTKSTIQVSPVVAADEDDYTIYATGGTRNTTINLAGNDNTQNVDMGLRFQLNVPQGATIVNGSLKGYQTDAYGGNISAKIHAHKSTNSAQITTYAGWSTAHGTLTTASVDWDAAGVSANTLYTSSDIGEILTEITSQSGWTANNYTQFFIDNDGSAAWQYWRFARHNSANPAKLVVDYQYKTWQVALASEPDMLMIDGEIGNKKASVAAMTSNNDWFWDSNVLYVYSTDDPSSKSIEYSVRSYGITTNSKNYITIQDISAKGTKEWGAGLAINASQYIVIDNCDLSYNYYCGILGLGADHGRLTVSNSIFSFNGSSGLTSYDGWGGYNDIGYNLITLNNVNNNGWRDIDAYGISGPFSNSTISHNEVYNNGLGGVSLPIYNHGIYVSNGTGVNIIVENNTTYGQTHGSGIKFAGSGVVKNNISYDNTSAGIQIGTNGANNITANIYYNICYGNGYGIAQLDKNAGDINLNIYNNTLYNNIDSTQVTNTREIMIGNGLTSLVVKNNVLSGTSEREIAAEAQSNMTWDYNIVHHASIYYDSAVRSWVQWQALGFDTHGVSSDPLFANVAGYDFHLLLASPAINAGTDVSLTTDYTGTNHIYGLPDIGAYEYQPTQTTGTNEIDVGDGVRIYGDGKFEPAASGSSAALSIEPASDVTTQYLDVAITTWNTTDTYSKEWTETSAAPTKITGNVSHTIGDLEEGKYYNVAVDGAITSLTNPDCDSVDSNFVCRADDEGRIAFLWTGGYSTHTFTVTEGDNIDPTVTDSTSAKFHTDTTTVTLSLTTDEASTCKYANENTTYDLMTSFITTGTTAHSTLITSLTPDTYTYSAICRDGVGNDTPYTLTFEIAKPEDKTHVSSPEIKTDDTTLLFNPNVTVSVKDQKIKLSGQDDALTNGTVKILKKKKRIATVEANGDGEWSKNLKLKDEFTGLLKVRFYDSYGTFLNERTTEVVVDEEKPVFTNQLPAILTLAKQDKISFPATDNESIDFYKVQLLDSSGHIVRSWRKQNQDYYLIPEGAIAKASLILMRAYDKAGNYTEQKANLKIGELLAEAEVQGVSTEPLPSPPLSQGEEGSMASPNTCSYTVASGDTLWSIAKNIYHDPYAYPGIIEKNKDKYPEIKSILTPGQELSFCDNDTNPEQNVEGASDTKDNPYNINPGIQDQTPKSNSVWWQPWTWW